MKLQLDKILIKAGLHCEEKTKGLGRVNTVFNIYEDISIRKVGEVRGYNHVISWYEGYRVGKRIMDNY